MTPTEHLSAISKCYPHAWRQADEMRADRGHGLPEWEPWCFLPMAGWYAIVSHQKNVPALDDFESVADVARLAALGSWRVSQGIYQYAAELYSSLLDTPLEGDMPADILLRLPEWCVYIETPELTWACKPLHGFWAHLEHDANNGGVELRLALDVQGSKPIGIPLHIGKWDLQTAMSRTVDEAEKLLGGENIDIPVKDVAKELRPLVSLLLYLCSTGPDVARGDGTPGAPGPASPVKTKKGWRLFPPDKPTIWRVGETISRQIRAARSGEQATPHAGPRPHIRRAHWHGFWSGTIKPKEGVEPTPRRFEVRWLPPVPVAMKEEE